MPMIVETLESWLRDYQRDLHLIEVDAVQSKTDCFASKYICPVTTVEFLNDFAL